MLDAGMARSGGETVRVSACSLSRSTALTIVVSCQCSVSDARVAISWKMRLVMSSQTKSWLDSNKI
jgi:hypothetical protein